jgi:hypothetical protein
VNPDDASHTCPFALAEAITFEDVWVYTPWLGKVIVVNEAVFFGAEQGALNPMLDCEFDGFAGTPRFVETFINDSFCELNSFVHLPPPLLVKVLCVRAEGAVFEGIGARLEVGEVCVHQDDAFEYFLAEGFFALESILVAFFERLNENGCASPTGFEGFI